MKTPGATFEPRQIAGPTDRLPALQTGPSPERWSMQRMRRDDKVVFERSTPATSASPTTPTNRANLKRLASAFFNSAWGAAAVLGGVFVGIPLALAAGASALSALTSLPAGVSLAGLMLGSYGGIVLIGNFVADARQRPLKQ